MTHLDDAALDAIEQRADAATDGPWERGDRQHVAGVTPRFGDGKCAYCERLGEPSWVGRRDINGRRMLAHVHESAEPLFEHGIYAHRADGSVIVVNDTDEYGYMYSADAEFIAHARTDIPALLAAVREARAAATDAGQRAEWADTLVEQVCASGSHVTWYADTEDYSHACPWCAAESLQQRLDEANDRFVAAEQRAQAAEAALQRVREVADNLHSAQYAPVIVHALRRALGDDQQEAP